MAVVTAKGEQKKTEEKKDRVDEKIMEPGKYEVTDAHTFSIDVHLRQLQDKRWIVVRGEGKGIDSHKVVFRMWTYDEMVELRKKATSYDTMRRMHMVDQDALNQLKVQKLMVSWTFGEQNPRLKIHRIQGVLTDESWANFKRLQTNIIDYIFGKMNEVLDYNG